VSDDRLMRLANRVARKVGDPEAASDYLHGALDRLQQLEAEGERGTNFGGLIDQVIAEIFETIDNDDIDAARAKGGAAFAQFKAQTQELAAATDKVVRTNIQTALLDLDVDGALHWVLEKLTLEAGGPPSLNALLIEQHHWYELALNRDLRLEMDLAIALARHNVETASDAEEYGVCYNNPGNALGEQGSRSGGDEGLKLLDKAVVAHRAALEVRTKETMPADWAMTQNNLCLANWVIVDLSDGPADRISCLEQAIGYYLEALTIYDPVNMPYDHGRVQNALKAVKAELLALRHDDGDKNEDA